MAYTMQKTPLFEQHEKLGASIVDFGGWAMPVQYTNVIEEHKATREQAGLFDICHMGEIELRGADAFALAQYLVSRDLSKQIVGQMMLSVICNEAGGIVDDLTVYKLAEDRYLLVTNASTKDKDLAQVLRLRNQLGLINVEVRDLTDQIGKLDLQGPAAETILSHFVTDDLSALKFYYFIKTRLYDRSCIISRSGYTGEDGFEIYLNSDLMVRLWDELLAKAKPYGLVPVGLGARDTLRLESAMNLYGHEMNEEINPFECRYGWVTDLGKDFHGVETLRQAKESGIRRRLVGFELEGRGIAREHYPIFVAGEVIGQVSSGTHSPTLGKPVLMGHVPVEYSPVGTRVQIQIRKNLVDARVVKLPFYQRQKS